MTRSADLIYLNVFKVRVAKIKAQVWCPGLLFISNLFENIIFLKFSFSLLLSSF